MNVLQELLSNVKPQSDGDFVDKLNHSVTAIALAFISLFITGWSFVGNPIDCWFPAHYTMSWIQYVLDYCFVENIFQMPYVNNDNQLSKEPKTIPLIFNDWSYKNEIKYFKWLPFILLFQSGLFYVPVLVWRWLCALCDVNISDMCDTIKFYEMNETTRKSAVTTVLKYILKHRDYHSRSKREWTWGRYGLSLSYMMKKMMFLSISLTQFMSLRVLMGADSYHWGYDVLKNITMGKEWTETTNFPRLSLCKLDVMKNQIEIKPEMQVVQCVLVLNYFNEKVILLMWWWLLMLLVLSAINFIQWMFRLFSIRSNQTFVKKYIQEMNPQINRNMGKLLQFTTLYMSPDTVLVLRFIEMNNGKSTVFHIMNEMWTKFNKTNELLLVR